MCAKNRHQQLASARSHQAGNTEHFGFAGRESNSIDEQLAGNSGILNRDVARLEHHLAALVRAFREYLTDFASDHFRDHPRFIEVCRSVGADGAAVAQYGDASADAEDLIELV